jgi:hypothetical protein
MKCPNPACGDKAEEHVASNGSGSRYCTAGCGYYEELPPGSMKVPRPERHEPVAPIKKPKRRRDY